MMKKIVSVFIGFLFLLFLPQNVLAQSCGGDGMVCTGIKSQSSCCNGYTCESNNVPGNPNGICKQSSTLVCGGKGEPCCATNNCKSSLVCSAENICVDPGPDIRCGPNGINTAIGCVPVLGSNAEFMGFILKWAVGIGGGIAFLLILYGGFMVMTSAGNPERLKAGQELLTSAISGLILLIFSVFILNFIGVDILGIFK